MAATGGMGGGDGPGGRCISAWNLSASVKAQNENEDRSMIGNVKMAK